MLDRTALCADLQSVINSREVIFIVKAKDPPGKMEYLQPPEMMEDGVKHRLTHAWAIFIVLIYGRS